LPTLDVDKDSVIVLQSAGPQGAPGMPEWGQLPIWRCTGPRDMLRVADARWAAQVMAPACCVESYVGGPLALSVTAI
jgi:dihydroxy-acid dehydratase